MQIGLYYGYIGLVDGICERMIAELGPATKVIGTGGFARMLAPDSKYLKTIDVNLTLDGVRLVYERNLERLRRRPARDGAAAPLAAG